MENEANTFEEICSLRDQLETIRSSENENALKYSRVQRMQYGEKPSKYFLNLEKQRFVEKTIVRLVDEGGNTFDKQQDILREVYSYYANLYKFQYISDVHKLFCDISSDHVQKLIPEDADSLEGEIQYSEIIVALKEMKNNKAPGQDGFTVELFKFFFNDLGPYFLKSVNHAYKVGDISMTQKLGIITLIPKGDKSRHYLKNWRPISLLNVTYKLLSRCLANRLVKILPKLIHTDHKSFLPGKFIGEI